MNIEGKTIASVKYFKYAEYDDEPFMQLNFTDGTHCIFEAGYGGWTSKSLDEYPAFIYPIDEIPERDGATIVEVE